MRILSILAVLLLGACAAPSCRPMLDARLFFGVPDEAEFDAFLDREVTPRFPSGLTVLEAAGRWRNPAGRMTQERSRVVEIVAAPGADTMARLDAIRDAYKAQFHQQSVGLVTSSVCADF